MKVTEGILIASLAIGVACAETNAPPVKPVMHVTTVKTDAGADIGEVRFALGATTNAFTSINAISEFLETLPKETRISYVAPYGQFYVLIGTNRMHIKEFGRMCKEKGVVFGAIVPDF